MKRVLLVVFSVFLPVVFAFGAPSDKQRNAIAEKLYGSIYITEFSGLADFSVYITEFSGLADLSVSIQEFSGLANSPGEWHIEENSGLADFSIYITEFSGLADLIVYIENPEAFPCRN